MVSSFKILRLFVLLTALLPGCGMSELEAASSPSSSSVVITVESFQQGYPISPFIYGSNMVFENEWDGVTLKLPLGRLGGNQWTPYNWEINGSNAGADSGHQNSGWLGGGDEVGGAVRKRVETIQSVGGTALVTVNMLDYVAADKMGGGDVNLTAAYLQNRFRHSQPRKAGALSLTPNKNDQSVYQDEFVNWVTSRFDRRRLFFSLDNEPDLWDVTHPRLRQDKVTYEEVQRRSLETARRIKEIAPESLVFGPALSGYMGFARLGEARDAQNRFFLDYYLGEMRKAETSTGKRLLDVLDLHWYPEHRGANNVRIIDQDNSRTTALARMQAPRSLWDGSYLENSWITQSVTKEPLRLIRSVRERIQKHYPGTRLAFTEYYFGGGDHISGAVAEADVLGIFGREQVYAATWWPWHMDEKPRFIQGAFRAYLNYDGRGAKFGDIAVPATTTDPAGTSVYASKFSDQSKSRTVVLINKGEWSRRAIIDLKGEKTFRTARAFVISGAQSSPVAGPVLKIAGDGTFQYEMPATSVTTLQFLP